MAHDHPLLSDARAQRLLEVRLRSIGPDFVVDAYFERAGERTHLVFIGVSELRISRFEPGMIGGAVTAPALRLRHRHGAILREEIARAGADPVDDDGNVRDLFAPLAH